VCNCSRKIKHGDIKLLSNGSKVVEANMYQNTKSSFWGLKMFEFTMRFQIVIDKSPMKSLAFPKEAKVKCKIKMCLFEFDKNLPFK
jgi:hypothetical protein